MALAESKEAEVNKEEEQVYDEAADKGLQAQEDDWAVNEYSVSGSSTSTCSVQKARWKGLMDCRTSQLGSTAV